MADQCDVSFISNVCHVTNKAMVNYLSHVQLLLHTIHNTHFFLHTYIRYVCRRKLHDDQHGDVSGTRRKKLQDPYGPLWWRNHVSLLFIIQQTYFKSFSLSSAHSIIGLKDIRKWPPLPQVYWNVLRKFQNHGTFCTFETCCVISKVHHSVSSQSSFSFSPPPAVRYICAHHPLESPKSRS